MKEKVIRLEDIRLISIAERTPETPQCRHRRITVDHGLWEVRCRDCQTTIDPIAWIASLAQEERALEFRVQRLRDQAVSVERQIAVLNRTKCIRCDKFTRIDKHMFYQQAEAYVQDMETENHELRSFVASTVGLNNGGDVEQKPVDERPLTVRFPKINFQQILDDVRFDEE